MGVVCCLVSSARSLGKAGPTSITGVQSHSRISDFIPLGTDY